MEKLNSKDWADVYSCKFLEAGIVSYEDSNAGIALLKKETIDKMASSFIGRPVIVQHKSVNPGNYQEHAVGYVIAVRFNPEDAWFYADFIVLDDAAKALIEDHGYSVSCAYNVLDAKEGGLWHDIKYDGEITEGSFTHLALVESPRYEDSKISKQLPAMLVNGKVACISTTKEEMEMSIFKLFKKKENDKQEDIFKSYVELETKAVPVPDLMLACMNGKKLDLAAYEVKNDKQTYMAQDHDIVDINGKTVSIGDLKANYMMKTQANEKKNCSCGVKSGEDHKKDCTFFNSKEDDDKEKEAKEKEMEAKKKNDKEAEDKKKEEEAKNAKEKEELEAKNAKEKAEAEEKDKLEKENSKKAEQEALEKKNAKDKLEAFFNELKNASAGEQVENDSRSVPKTRAERAVEFRNRTSKKS